MNFADLNVADATTTLESLTYFVIGVVVYTISVSNFYRFMG